MACNVYSTGSSRKQSMSQLTTAPQTRSTKRTLTKHELYRYFRLVHGWLSALAFVALCFFAFTGLLLNHPEWFAGSNESIKQTFTLTADELERLQDGSTATKALVDAAAKRVPLRGELGDDSAGDLVGDELFVRMQGVRGDSFLRAHLRTGEVEVTVEPTSTISILNELHRAERAGDGWRLAVDVIAVLLIVLSVVGYLIFLSMRGKRIRTALALTFASTLGLYVLFVVAVSLSMILLPPLDLPDTKAHEEVQIDSGSYVFRDEAILGTRMHIELVARNHSDALAAALAARSEIDRLNAILNSHNPNSELSALNRSRIHRASPELFDVIAAAERWRLETAGNFSGRLGRAIEAWRNAHNIAPDRESLANIARAADTATVELDEATRTIVRPDAVTFALDAVAKGWIVDRAFEVACAAPGVLGALVDIGGDIRCGGRTPDSRGWRIGVPDAVIPVDNAPLSASVRLFNAGIATSGRGPRDRVIGGVRYSPTLSPHDAWPVQHAVSVTVVAASTAEADAMATALLVMPIEQGVSWANRNGVSARIATDTTSVLTHAGQSQFVAANAQPSKKQVRAGISWPKDWAAYITFTAPPRQLVRDQYFRSPFVAIWISDTNNKPIRTLLLVGRDVEWQQDNYIWWSLNERTAKHLVMTRSMSTSGSGVYKVLWDGVDDQGKHMPGGTYVLHIETSRERGKHTHRSLRLDFSEPKTFSDELPSTDEAGGIHVEFYRP
jgi:thiamine biosynthesis lipoprotein